MRLGDRYVLQRQLRREDEVTIWLARDSVLGRSVDVRTLDRDMAGPDRVERLEHAARGAAGLTHPNVVQVLDVGTDAGITYVVTEHLDGVELAQVLEAGPLDPEQATAYAIQILTAFETARSAGVGHGPISTRDIVAVGNSVKVSGFATSDAADAHGPAEDVRAAGMLLYEMLTAAPAPTTEPATPVRAQNPRVPRELDAMTSRALATDTDERYTRPQDMIAALSRMRREGPPSPADTGEHHPGMFRSWMLVPLVLLVLTVAAIVTGIALGKLELGGPLLVRTVPDPVTPSAEPDGRRPLSRSLTPVSVEAFDPFGDEQESDEQLPSATDGNRTTAWQTEDYFDGELGKPGVGLLLDLGDRMTVTRFRLTTPDPGYDFRVLVGEDPASLARARGRSYLAEAVNRERLRPTEGRFVLIWLTSVVPMPDGTHRASIGEVAVEGFDE